MPFSKKQIVYLEVLSNDGSKMIVDLEVVRASSSFLESLSNYVLLWGDPSINEFRESGFQNQTFETNRRTSGVEFLKL